jgi:hypothetical protein
MSSSRQEISARRFSVSQFDCELPQAALDELMQLRQFVENEGHAPLTPTQQLEHAPHQAEIALQRERAENHVKPPAPPQRPPCLALVRSWWHPALGWLLALAAVVAVLAVSWPSPEQREKALRESAQASRSAEEKATAAMEALRKSVPQPTPAPAATPFPAPVQQQAPANATQPAVQTPAAAPRAQLVRLPSQELGVYKWYPLPPEWGGGSVLARYLGTVERFSEIPPNPIPGDLWNVTEGNASWVYCTPLNYNHPIWIDP